MLFEMAFVRRWAGVLLALLLVVLGVGCTSALVECGSTIVHVEYTYTNFIANFVDTPPAPGPCQLLHGSLRIQNSVIITDTSAFRHLVNVTGSVYLVVRVNLVAPYPPQSPLYSKLMDSRMLTDLPILPTLVVS